MRCVYESAIVVAVASAAAAVVVIALFVAIFVIVVVIALFVAIFVIVVVVVVFVRLFAHCTIQTFDMLYVYFTYMCVYVRCLYIHSRTLSLSLTLRLYLQQQYVLCMQ